MPLIQFGAASCQAVGAQETSYGVIEMGPLAMGEVNPFAKWVVEFGLFELLPGGSSGKCAEKLAEGSPCFGTGTWLVRPEKR